MLKKNKSYSVTTDTNGHQAVDNVVSLDNAKASTSKHTSQNQVHREQSTVSGYIQGNNDFNVGFCIRLHPF